MIQYTQLVKRNLLMYLRDKGVVFFSLLSMLVVLCLMVFFLGDINIGVLTDELSALPGRDAAKDEVDAYLLILAWTIGGIIPTNSVMVTLSSYSAMIKDKNSRRSDAIYTSPVNRTTIALSYITATCLASIIICILTLAFAELFFVIKGGNMLSLVSHFSVISMIVINSFSYSAIMYLFATLVKTESAWSGFGTVIGALVGFFGGNYMPIGQLAEPLQKIVKCTPIIYSTVMFRNVICKDTFDALFNGVPKEISEIYGNTMGISITLFEHNISPIICCVISVVTGCVCLASGMLVLKIKRRKGAK
ncbi:MAG: ABC transporter permease [Clostridia bacterium]|nr:ABC transporter permease [Clostridia bacterium]